MDHPETPSARPVDEKAPPWKWRMVGGISLLVALAVLVGLLATREGGGGDRVATSSRPGRLEGSIELTVSPQDPIAGQEVTFTAKVEGGILVKQGIEFGDPTGPRMGFTAELAACGNVTDDENRTSTYRYTYREPGTYEVVAAAELQECDHGRDTAVERRATVTVRQAPG